MKSIVPNIVKKMLNEVSKMMELDDTYNEIIRKLVDRLMGDLNV